MRITIFLEESGDARYFGGSLNAGQVFQSIINIVLKVYTEEIGNY